MSSIDRLIGSVGSTEMLPVLSNIVQGLLTHNDWRYVYAAIMALSQVGEYID
jgi:importin-5